MEKILVVTASPLAEYSVSCRLADVFMKNYQVAHPEDQLKRIDLSRLELPEIDEELIAYFNGQSDGDSGMYTEIDDLCEEFMTLLTGGHARRQKLSLYGKRAGRHAGK